MNCSIRVTSSYQDGNRNKLLTPQPVTKHISFPPTDSLMFRIHYCSILFLFGMSKKEETDKKVRCKWNLLILSFQRCGYVFCCSSEHVIIDFRFLDQSAVLSCHVISACSFFDIPVDILPEIRSSSEVYGHLTETKLKGLPVSGVRTTSGVRGMYNFWSLGYVQFNVTRVHTASGFRGKNSSW